MQSDQRGAVCKYGSVSTAVLVLEYVKTLTWPALVGAGMVMFKGPISSKIRGLKTFDAGAVKTTFETDASALESKAAEVAAQVEASTEPETPALDEPKPTAEEESSSATEVTFDDSRMVSTTKRAVAVALARRSLDELQGARDFSVVHELASVHPNAAVMIAYRQFEQAARAAGGLLGLDVGRRVQAASRVVGQLGLDQELTDVVRELQRLRNAVTHSVEDVTVAGAESYVAAAEEVTSAVVSITLSRLRHPSQAQRTEELMGLSLGDDEGP